MSFELPRRRRAPPRVLAAVAAFVSVLVFGARNIAHAHAMLVSS
jgi:hypothetical protein